MARPNPSLRLILAVTFGGIALLAALGTSLLAGQAAGRRLEAGVVGMLDAHAGRIAERLDREVAARWRDVKVAATLPSLRDPATPLAVRRGVLAELHDTDPAYVLLAFIGRDGRVVVDSRQRLEGMDASGRAFVRDAMDHPVMADVHDALLLAGPPDGDPGLRILDLAAPVRGADGALVGVVAAQIDWRRIATAVGSPRPGEPEVLVLSRAGTVLLGPPALLGHALPEARTREGGAAFPDGDDVLVATEPTRGYGDYPGLGWVVVARLPRAAALAPARVLQRDILAYGLAAAAMAATLGWLAAAWFARPLRRLATAAARLRADPASDPLPPGTGYAEAATLAEAFAALLGDCRRSEAALRDSEQRLRLAQRAGQIGAYEWDIPADSGQATREFAALHGQPLPAGDVTWTDTHDRWLSRLHPEDQPRQRERVARIVAEPGPYALEYRILLPDGRTRWLADRGEVMAGPDGRPARAFGAIRDVTGRRAAEDALREGEARLRLAQEAGGIGSWDLDLATGRQVWSDRQYQLFGLDPALAAPDLPAWLAMLHPDDRDRVLASRQQAVGSESGNFSAEFRIHRPADGAERWMATSGRVMRDAAGRAVRMLGVNRDITEARQREAALQAREAELRAMLEASPIGVLRGDIHGRIVDANDALLRLAGHDRASLAAGALRWDALTPPEWRPRDLAAIAEAQATGTCTPYEKEYLRPDGSRVPVLVGFALVGAAREGTIAFILDLTDRKRAEAALLRDKAELERRVAEQTQELAVREHELRRIYDQTPAAFHSVDAEGRLFRVSAEWLAFLGYAREEVLGRRTGEFMLPDSAARWDQAVQALKQAGDQVRDVEYRMRRRDGRIVDVLLRARAEYDGTGRFVSSYAVLFDLTERNQAEARLREAQTLEALGRIAGGVAHDFNNLLQVMTGGLRLMESAPGDRDRVERYTRIALEAAGRGAGLTRRMLAFARQDRLQAGPVDLAAALRALEVLLRGPLGTDIRVEIVAPDDLPPVRADRMQLDLVLFNLALNARDAMPEGGVLRLQAAAEALPAGNPQALPAGDYLRICVSDTGLGMDAVTLARATEPFFTTREVGQGSGLGLSMAHGFALQSGGSLQIDSTPGQGTAVTFWLPEAEPALPEAEPALPQAAATRPDCGLAPGRVDADGQA